MRLDSRSAVQRPAGPLGVWGRLDVTRDIPLPRSVLIAALGAVILIVLVGWIWTVRDLDPRAITDIGLISIMPVTAYGLVGVLALSFVLALRMGRLSEPLLLAHVLGLIFMLYGATTLFEELPRFVTAWLHVGFVESIARTGELHPLRDARFDWPAFFVLFAFLQNVARMDSLLPIIAWVPVVLMALYLPPLYLIYRSATADLRLVWLGLWIFVMANWVGQEYFSPQGMNILLFLTIVAVLVTWFRADPSRTSMPSRFLARVPGMRGRERVLVDPNADTEGGPRAWVSDHQQIGLVAIITLVFGLSVASHQLTPFALVGALVLLVMTRRLTLWGIPMVMMVLLSAWLTFMAATFLEGHLAGLLEDLGRPDQFAASNVSGRLRGSPGHVLAIQARLAFTFIIWIIAFVGGVRRIRAGRLDLTLALFAIAPFGLIMLQGYGGEMLLRIFLFGVAFMAFFVAASLLPTERPMSWKLSGGVVVGSVLLAFGFLFTHNGNERSDIVSVREFEALEFLTDTAADGDTIARINHQVPIGYREWEQMRVVSINSAFYELDEGALTEALRERTREGQDAYIIVSRSNQAYASMFQGMTLDEWQEHLDLLLTVVDVEEIFRNEDAVVYRWLQTDLET